MMGLFDRKYKGSTIASAESSHTKEGFRNETNEGSQLFDADAGVKRGLQDKHIAMMAIAGIIGSGLIVGTSQALINGGPAALIIGFGSIGLIAATVMQSIGEMAIFPDGGGFLDHTIRFVNKPFGAMVSINYFLCFAMVLASEYSALMSIFTQVEGEAGSWNPDHKIPQWAVFLLFWLFFTAFQSVGVSAFGWSEYYLAWLKLLGLFAFFIFALVYVCGGIKNRPAFGFHYWNDPGAFADGFRGVAKVFIFCSTFYAGAEGVAVTATESRNPGKAIPSAVKSTLIRIIVIYMGSAIFIGMTCPYNAEQFGTAYSKTLRSPFTVAIQNAGWLHGYNLVNAFLITVLLSGINASIYLCTRTVLYMANRGSLPKLFAWTDRRGVPFPAMLFSNSIGFIALMNISQGAAQAYTYIVNISGVCIFIVWGAISFSHLRFRRAWHLQGYARDELKYESWLFPWIPLASVVANIFLMLVQGWTTLSPFDSKNFVDSYIMLPASLIFYAVYAIVHKQWKFQKAAEIDLQTGRREDLDIEDKESVTWTQKTLSRIRRVKASE